MRQRAKKITEIRIRLKSKGVRLPFRAAFVWTDRLVGPGGCRLEPKAVEKGQWSAILKS